MELGFRFRLVSAFLDLPTAPHCFAKRGEMPEIGVR